MVAGWCPASLGSCASESLEWIDSRGAASGNIARGHDHEREDRTDGGERDGVARRDDENERAQQAGGAQRQRYSCRDAKQPEHESLSNDEPPHRTVARPERETHAELAVP